MNGNLLKLKNGMQKRMKNQNSMIIVNASRLVVIQDLVIRAGFVFLVSASPVSAPPVSAFPVNVSHVNASQDSVSQGSVILVDRSGTRPVFRTGLVL
jgi:hypothetical protein